MSAPSELADASGHPVLFFDGVCNLCNASVDWVIRRDAHRIFRFASLQGETAQRLVPDFAEEAGLSTVVLLVGSHRYLRSTAVGHVLLRLGGLHAMLGRLLLLIPRPVRDWFYRRVAANRYRRWGKRETCRVPSPEERAQFLP